MIMEGALLKLSVEKSDFVVQAGESVEIPFRLQRLSKTSAFDDSTNRGQG